MVIRIGPTDLLCLHTHIIIFLTTVNTKSQRPLTIKKICTPAYHIYHEAKILLPMFDYNVVTLILLYSAKSGLLMFAPFNHLNFHITIWICIAQ